MSSHAHKNQARQYHDQHKLTYMAGLQQIRDCPPPAPDTVRTTLAPNWTADTMPQKLLTAVDQHCQ